MSEPDTSGQAAVPEAGMDGPGELAAAIVATISQPFLVLDDGLRIELANPAFLDRFQVTPGETIGQQLRELGDGQWNIPGLWRLLEEVASRPQAVTGYRVEHEFARVGRKIMLLDANPIARGGALDRILLAITDITEREQLVFDLEARREFAEKLVDSVREGLMVLSWDLRVRSANQSFYRTFGVQPAETEDRPIFEIGNGQWNIPRLRTLLEDILPRENRFDDFEVEHEFERIGARMMLLNARQLDHEQLILLAIRDVTEERRAKVQRAALMAELQHRIKNILNNVRALSVQSQRSASLETFAEAFDARLQALARTQDLLVRGPLEKVGLADLVRLELEARGGREGATFTLDGPEVRLSPRDAQVLAMTIHELTTNALKYGALAVDSGRVEVTWRTEPRDAGSHLRLRWQEHGHAIEDLAPTRGFGARVIEESLPYILGGTSKLSFHADGATCAIEFPLPEE